MKRRHIALIAAALVLLVLLAEAGRYLLTRPGDESKKVVVEVIEGDPFSVVAGHLADAGVIAKPAYFRVLAQLTGSDRVIQAGEYAFQTQMRPLKVLEQLTTGSVIQIAVTIPEGYAMRDIAALLESRQLMKAEDFLAAASEPGLIKELGLTASTLEGYLYPSTYYLTRRTTAPELVRRMVQEFQSATQGWEWGLPPGYPKLTAHQVVTLASIIEKETSRDEERALIAAVFTNRLKRRMPLQSDPTVIYGLAKFDGNLRRRDLKAKSPYNTYTMYGLPPGPIANPGVASMKAALQPATVNFLYFVSKNDGTHLFSATLAEHQRAVAQYQLKRRAAKRGTS